MTVHAFLGRPNDSSLQAFQDEASIVDPFTISTAVDHAAERAAFGSYRCVLPRSFLQPCVYPTLRQDCWGNDKQAACRFRVQGQRSGNEDRIQLAWMAW